MHLIKKIGAILSLFSLIWTWFYFVTWYLGKTGKNKTWWAIADFAVLRPILFWLLVQVIFIIAVGD